MRNTSGNLCDNDRSGYYDYCIIPIPLVIRQEVENAGTKNQGKELRYCFFTTYSLFLKLIQVSVVPRFHRG